MSKNGFSYYKAETDRFQDIKIKRLKKKYGCDGYAVYQYVLNEIYRVDGSYIRWTEDQLFDCADYWGMNEERVKEIVDYCTEICLFDPIVWKTQCILTSRAIQSRYLDICKVSKKKAYIPLAILLVEPEQPNKETAQMPLFGSQGNQMKVKDAPALQETLQSTPEVLENIPECSGDTPEKNDKEKKNKTKQTSSTPPMLSRPLTEEEAKSLLSSTVLGNSVSVSTDSFRQQSPQVEAEEEKARNPKGLIDALAPYNFSSRELEEVLTLSKHGEIGNPVWQILSEMHGNRRIKMPRLFLLKRLRDATGLVIDTKNRTAS